MAAFLRCSLFFSPISFFPSLLHSSCKPRHATMASELSSLEAPPVIPKFIRAESDLTWHSSLSFPTPTDYFSSHVPPDHHVSLVRSHKKKYIKKNKPYRLVRQQQIKNSLLAGVGYLELANAGDFAANVWNQIPVPKHAMILMAIGGPIALSMTFFAVRDFYLSYQNVRLLRAEREDLLALRERLSTSPEEKDGELVRVLDSRLGVGIRELGTEMVDRMVMDVLMGLGALMVGVGTIMAIFGANPRVYKASNLLSGYVGNSMAAVFGLFNAVWSGVLVWRFQLHDRACQRCDDTSSYMLMPQQKQRLRTRFRRFQWHAITNAVNGLVAGAASMVTATRWWGYVVLIPCIISLILCNYYWRYKLGYDRPIISSSSSTLKIDHVITGTLPPLLADLSYVSAVHDALAQSSPTALPRTVVNLDSLESLISFIAQNHMFESFCEWLLQEDQSVIAMLVGDAPSVDPQGQITLSPKHFVQGYGASNEPDAELADLLLERARGFLKAVGRKVFAYRERYLLELLGYAVWREQTGSRS